MNRSVKIIPMIIMIVCIALILISVYLEQRKKAKILGSVEANIQITNPSEEYINEDFG